MADEKLPNPDSATPGTPSSRPAPSFSQDVVYAGAPVTAARPDAGSPASPAAPVAAARTDAITAAPPAGPQAPPARPAPKAGDKPHHSELALFFSWCAGVLLILCCGWGFIALCFYAPRWLHWRIPFEVSVGVGILGSLGMLFLLEKDLWLTRFMGLRLGPHSTQITETLFFFFTGIVGLLLRSSDKPAPVAARANENDGTREIVETVVFVVVLVLLLKTFLVEAFVIPTGSMADTLLGYHRDFPCDKCGYPRFVVNCSNEAEPPPNREPEHVIGGFCPNCRAPIVRK